MKEYKKNKVKIKDGAVITGYKGEYIFEIINDTKDYYESIILNEWVKKIGKPEVIFDIGANIGNHTVFFAKHTDALKIYSFEPYKINFERLNDNVKDNGYMGKVELYSTAVGEKKGKLILKNIDERNLGSATFDYSNNSEGDFSVIRLDDFVKEKK